MGVSATSRNAYAESAAGKVTIDQSGTVHSGEFEIPFSSLASQEAKKALIRKAQSVKDQRPAAIEEGPGTEELAKYILKLREQSDQARQEIAQEMASEFPVQISSETVGGVQTDVVMPREGVSAENKQRILINLHGGGMIFGAHYEGQVLSIPIASIGKIKVITIDYRMAPEHRFPAASEDVAAVYSELLKHYRPENIGIYGCSAGGMLTAQSVAWFQTHDLPRPGAVGILAAGAGSAIEGDSYYIAPVMSGMAAPIAPRVSAQDNWSRALTLYVSDADLHDPLVTPMYSKAVLAKFPPTLILNSTRDYTLSVALYSQRQLSQAGVPVQLLIWDGLEHAFMYDAKLPESREAYDVIVRFFEKHLGTTTTENTQAP